MCVWQVYLPSRSFKHTRSRTCWTFCFHHYRPTDAYSMLHRIIAVPVCLMSSLPSPPPLEAAPRRCGGSISPYSSLLQEWSPEAVAKPLERCYQNQRFPLPAWSKSYAKQPHRRCTTGENIIAMKCVPTSLTTRVGVFLSIVSRSTGFAQVYFSNVIQKCCCKTVVLWVS